MRQNPEDTLSEQSKAFMKLAKDLGCDTSEAAFENAVKKVAKPAATKPQRRKT